MHLSASPGLEKQTQIDSTDSSTRQLVLISHPRYQQEALSQKQEKHAEGTLEADFPILCIHVYLHRYTHPQGAGKERGGGEEEELPVGTMALHQNSKASAYKQGVL